MRYIDVPRFERPVSVIGFGGASLGSRTSEQEGRRALERALAAGINWIDVAPSYGDGQAERIVGDFTAAHRGEVFICTKVGIVADGIGWKSLLRPLARRVVSAFPRLRRVAKRARTVQHVPLLPETIETSVDRSLRTLRVQTLDAVLLHSATPDEVARDDIAATLVRIRQNGKVRAVGVASGVEAARQAARHPDVYDILQLANNPFEPNAELDWVAAARRSGQLIITHSALGTDGAFDRLRNLVTSQQSVAELMLRSGYQPAARGVSNFLFDFALSSNTGGIALQSMMAKPHLEQICQRAALSFDATGLADLGRTLRALETRRLT